MPTLGDMKRQSRKKPAIVVKVGNIKVPIYKRERVTANGKSTRVIFEVADYTAGKRRLRGFTEEIDARKEGEKIARQLSTGETTAAMMRNSDAASYGRALELIKPTGATLEHAALIYAKIYEICGGDYGIEAAKFFTTHRADRIQQKKVSEVVTELLQAKEARKKSDRYIADLRARLTKFASTFAVDISTITPPDVQGWLDKLNLAPQTAKNYRTVLYTLFSFAEARGYIFKGGNPVEDTESIEVNGGAAIEIYTPDEITKLLNAAATTRKDFLPVVVLGGFAGLRTAEIERLHWSDVDFSGGYIHVAADKAKTRSRRLVPISANLSHWLVPYSKQTGKVWTGTPDTLRDARGETVKAAEIAWKDNALRHSYISYRLADTNDAAKVSLEAGNSAQMVFKHYRELVRPEAAKAWFAITPEAAQ